MSIKSFIKVHLGDKYYRVKNFGIIYILDFTLCSIARKLGLPMRCFWANEVDYRYMKRRYGRWNYLAKYQSSYKEGNTIWVMWWQGIENSPQIVKKCYESVLRNRNGYSVVVIDKDNYSEYIDIPKQLLDKVNNGKITLTCFSDYIRFALLKKWGGYYLDATIIVNRPLMRLGKEVYSVKHEKNSHFISEAKWSSYLWYIPKNHPLPVFFVDVFERYWKEHDVLINYFLVDFITRLFYDNDNVFKNQIDKLKIESPDIYFFHTEEANNPFDNSTWNKIEKRNKFFKCNWKSKKKINKGSFLDVVLN